MLDGRVFVCSVEQSKNWNLAFTGNLPYPNPYGPDVVCISTVHLAVQQKCLTNQAVPRIATFTADPCPVTALGSYQATSPRCASPCSVASRLQTVRRESYTDREIGHLPLQLLDQQVQPADEAGPLPAPRPHDTHPAPPARSRLPDRAPVPVYDVPDKHAIGRQLGQLGTQGPGAPPRWSALLRAT
jgi:hypothetical protein